jgi:hypothetical protein
MADYPNGTLDQPGLQSVVNWEKVVFGLKPTLRVTHVIAYQPSPPSPLGCVTAIKQLYASHYLRAAIDFSACVTVAGRDPRDGFYLVSLKGSQQEGVTGFTGSIVRRIIVGRAREAMEGSLMRIKAAIEPHSTP